MRDVGGKARIEFPMGKVLYETTGHVSYARLSPKGDRIAFLDHPFPLDDAGTVAVIDLAGKKTTLTGQVGERARPRLVAFGRRGLVHGDRGGRQPVALRGVACGQAPRRDPRAGRPEAPRRRAAAAACS